MHATIRTSRKYEETHDVALPVFNVHGMVRQSQTGRNSGGMMRFSVLVPALPRKQTLINWYEAGS
jgi:hypothetical protein